MVSLSPSVHALRLPFTIRPVNRPAIDRFVYAYIIRGGQPCLVDSGTAASVPSILSALHTLPSGTGPIRFLVLTHAHPDHIGGAFEIQKASGCEVLAHAKEKAWIEDTDLQAQQRPVPGFTTLVRNGVRVDRVLADGDRVSLGEGQDLFVLHTPGHSPGSISLHYRKEKMLFTGDAVPVPGEPPIYEDPHAAVQSLLRLRGIRGVSVLLSAWQDPVHGGDIAPVLEDSIAWIRRIHAAAVASQKGCGDPKKIVLMAVRRIGLAPEMLNPLAEQSIRSHLEFLDDPLLH